MVTHFMPICHNSLCFLKITCRFLAYHEEGGFYFVLPQNRQDFLGVGCRWPIIEREGYHPIVGWNAGNYSAKYLERPRVG